MEQKNIQTSITDTTMTTTTPASKAEQQEQEQEEKQSRLSSGPIDQEEAGRKTEQDPSQPQSSEDQKNSIDPQNQKPEPSDLEKLPNPTKAETGDSLEEEKINSDTSNNHPTVPGLSSSITDPKPTATEANSEPKIEPKPDSNDQNTTRAETQTSVSETTATDLVQNMTPQIQELANVFPQIQPSILEAVLAAHGNDTSACISDLLAMSDPTYKPSEQEVMEKSDEELARQLCLQDSQQADYSSHQYQQQQQQQYGQAQLSNLPYQPRVKRNAAPSRNFRPGTQQSQAQQQYTSISQNQHEYPADGKDEIQKIAEEIGKLAESGKKTMTMWLSKAKAKMQEMQQPTPPVDSTGSSNDLDDSYEHIHRPSSTSPSASTGPIANLNQTNPPTTRNTRITPNLPYGSRYHSSNQHSRPIDQDDQPNLLSSGSSKPVKGYNIEDSHSNNQKDLEKLALDNQYKSNVPTSTTTTHNSIFGSNSASAGPSSTRSTHQKILDDDEESLEYTRNPFEDDD